MPQFSKRIKVGQDYLTFYFNTLYTTEGLRYHVSVVGKDRKVYAFTMQYQRKWLLTDPSTCPDWIVKLEPDLNQIIENNKEE